MSIKEIIEQRAQDIWALGPGESLLLDIQVNPKDPEHDLDTIYYYLSVLIFSIGNTEVGRALFTAKTSQEGVMVYTAQTSTEVSTF